MTPVPDARSEYQFAGLLRGAKTELVKCLGSDLQVPASAEIVLEGVIHADDRFRGGARRDDGHTQQMRFHGVAGLGAHHVHDGLDQRARGEVLPGAALHILGVLF